MEELEYGPVLISEGKYEGFVGYYDDESEGWDEEKQNEYYGAVVYLSAPLYSSTYIVVPHEYLQEINSQILLKLQDEFWRAVYLKKFKNKKLSKDKMILLYQQLHYIDTLLYERLIEATFIKNELNDKKIFISHSSLDKKFVRNLAIDLKSIGYGIWFDEWEIEVGESIPKAIAKGLNDVDFVVLVLSKNSTNSNWVEQEWLVKYYEEVNTENIKLLPIIIEDCEVPTMLKHKKYINFKDDYDIAFNELCKSIKRLIEKNKI